MTRICIKRFIPVSVSAVAVLAFLGAVPAGRVFFHSHSSGVTRNEITADELLVRYKTQVPYQKRLSSLRRNGGTRMRELSRTGYAHVRLPKGTSLENALRSYVSDPDVAAVQPNFRYTAASTPNDPSSSSQWGVVNSAQAVPSPSYTLPDSSPISNPGTSGCDINISAVWDEITDASAVTVAVLDTGVNYNHEDLKNSMWDGGTSYPHHGWDFTESGGDDPIDRNGHGTMTAGIIGAQGNNGLGGTGVCWRSSIMAVKVLDAAGNGNSADLVEGISFAVEHGAKVLCISLVTHSFDQAVYDALKIARERGVLVVAAAGNDAADIDDGSHAAYPGAYDLDNIICVTALDQNFAPARFANSGIKSVDLAAPGVNIVNTWAGTVSSISDNFASGWTAGDVNHPGTSGWGATWESDSLCPSVKHWCLVNPSFDECYANNIQDKVWRDYTPFGKSADGVMVSFTVDYAFFDSGDSLGVYVKNTSYEPGVNDSVKLCEYRGGAGKQSVSFDLTGYVSGKDSFQLMYYLGTSVTGNAASGVAVSDMSVSGLWLSSSAYANRSGTSLAAAHAAGLAALLFAFNPEYTAADVAKSMAEGGRSLASLGHVTRTGRAADASGAFDYISAPEGVGAEPVRE